MPGATFELRAFFVGSCLAARLPEGKSLKHVPSLRRRAPGAAPVPELRADIPFAARWTRLLVGLSLFGPAIALMIRSDLGLGPWDAFHLGLHRLTGVSVGTVIVGVGLLVVLGATRIGVRPGPGTVVNMLLVGLLVDLVLPLVPAAPGWAWGLAYYAAAVPIAGFATGLYISAGLGPGPRDGLMLGVSRRGGWPVRHVRTAMELGVLAAGWAMGGTVGVGTLLFTLTIGPASQWGLQLFGLGTPDAPPREPAEGWRARRRAA